MMASTDFQVGSDTPGKQEVAREVVERVVAEEGLLVSDVISQGVRLGELQSNPQVIYTYIYIYIYVLEL